MSGEVNVLFADDAFVRELNRKYLSKDEFTDVIAFPMQSDGIIGDVAVSADRARAQAEEYGHPACAEAVLLAVHGALHLAGYSDGTPAERAEMEKRQHEIMEKLKP